MKKYFILQILLIMFSQAVFSQQEINLYNGAAPNSKKADDLSNIAIETPMGKIVTVVRTPTLTIYLPSKEKATGAAVIICPGGGYAVLVMNEGDTIAKRFSEAGVAGIVLKYRLPNSNFVDNKEMAPLQDAQQAIITVRENAKLWGIDPDKIGILGASAGGHLAATIATHYQQHYAANANGINLRPDFLILLYPVISFADSITHYGTRYNLIGEDLPQGEMERILKDWKNSEKEFIKFSVPADKIREYSNELFVTPGTPPTFITHATDDPEVKIENSKLFISVLQKNKVKTKSFFYDNGGHGYGIYNPTGKDQWFDSCLNWLGSKILLKEK